MALSAASSQLQIEFPSILLPPDISSGSIVDITVARNLASEKAAAAAFHNLQSTIYRTFGQHTPAAPVLRCRNATQTSVVLEWDPIDVATAELRGLTLYRNGSKAGTIPKPTELHSTKLSGLAVDSDYVFQLVLRTSAGTYSSAKLEVRTHKMTDLSGITVTPGHMAAPLRESLLQTAERIGAKVVDSVRIDTTHFVCTEGRGQAWEKAVEMNIPVVVPDWVKGCERDGRIVGVRGYYLNADPRLRQIGLGSSQAGQSALSPSQPPSAPPAPRSPILSPRTEITPPTPDRLRQGDEPVHDTPPPPPPKDRDEQLDAPEPKTATDEQKVRTTDFRPDAHDKNGSVHDSDDSEQEEVRAAQVANEAEALAERTRAQQPKVDDEEEDGKSFEEVSL